MQGYEGSPKGRVVRRKCMNIFHVTIETKFLDKVGFGAVIVPLCS